MQSTPSSRASTGSSGRAPEGRAVRELQALSDHELRDIGMARGEIVSVVAAQTGRTERRRYARS